MTHGFITTEYLLISTVDLKYVKEFEIFYDAIYEYIKNLINPLCLESEFGESWRYGSGGGCETCSHRRTTSCYGVLALLAIDIFTIGLILILFNKIYRPPQGKTWGR